MIRMRIDEVFGNILTESECDALASLIYNPEAEMARREQSEHDFDAWCRVSIRRLIAICRVVSNKYTRSKVKKRLPVLSSYIMDELLFSERVRYICRTECAMYGRSWACPPAVGTVEACRERVMGAFSLSGMAASQERGGVKTISSAPSGEEIS